MDDTLHTLYIEGLSHDGRGIARLPDPAALCGPHAVYGGGRGVVVFVAGALPGQNVRARIIRRKSGFMEAAVQELLRPAPDAVPPLCPHQEHCGGCPLQTMPYAGQLHWKKRLALDALHRIGRLDRDMLDHALQSVDPSPALRQYRNKMEFAFGPASGQDHGLTLGLRRRNGREVAPVPGCVLLPPEAQSMVSLARDLAEKSGLPAHTPVGERRNGAYGMHGNGRGGRKSARSECCAVQSRAQEPSGFWRFLILRRGLTQEGRDPRWWALCLTSPGGPAGRKAARALGQGLLEAFPSLAAFIHEERATPDGLALGERRVLVLDGQGREAPEAALLHLPLAGRLFGLDAASFFQVNTAAAQVLARRAEEMLADSADFPEPGSGLLDLYCGVGAPGLVLAPAFERLIGLEQDRRAVDLARRNAARMGFTHCSYLAGDAAALLNGKGGDKDDGGLTARQWNTALVDPPRAGLAPRALDALLRLAPRRVLYISCNPATLARDALQLSARYALERLAAVDLFPHTPHLECLSLWQRR